MTGGEAWYCLRSRTKRELFAAASLEERTGLEVFAPRLLVRRRGMREGRTTAEPLFPSYLFCRFDPGRSLRLVLSTPDVSGVVRFGDRTPTVPDPMIEFLRTQTAQPHMVAPVLVLGDWVEVLTGSFMGQTGRVVSFASGEQRACILLALLGSEVRVTLPVASLKAPRTTPPFPSPLLARSA